MWIPESNDYCQLCIFLLHRGGPLRRSRTEIWKLCIFKCFMPFLGGHLFTAENAFKNLTESYSFTRILNFWNISARSKYGLDEILFGHIWLVCNCCYLYYSRAGSIQGLADIASIGSALLTFLRHLSRPHL